MEKNRLFDIFQGKEDNCLLPFFWMHDGHNAELPQLVEQVYLSGARALCVESRPHEQFCRQEWWDDMDVILAEAQKRDMKVWILDDKHFPTGYANGLVPEKYPERRKWQLAEEHVDVVGPAAQNAVLLPYAPGEDEILLGVYAYRRAGAEETLSGPAVDLTQNVRGRYVFWDVPAGVYRIFAIYKTRRGTNQNEYVHLIDPESVRVLIEAVYEPHYAHYQQYFGTTIAGFFSDEPSLGNVSLRRGGHSHSMYEQMLGQSGLALPWTDELLARLNEALGEDALPLLAGLWYPLDGGRPDVRVAYMDVLTRLWREAFSLQLGSWCRAHGVEYIGHVIEDMNAHMRLGCSGGHYFRALDGQDMAGIDVVLHQIMPGMAHHKHTASCSGGYTDPEFFDYVLARLASSHSHIQPRMKNRAMCEIFGAYGWAEGTPFMRRLMDHMLVRGINRFVPHAFSPKYPDPDCPPHFNAGGCNPQFSGFAKLMHYTNKAVHLLEGEEKVSAAILYNAEAEWSGRDYMLMQKPAKALYDEQLNYDFLPADAIIDQARAEGGELAVEAMRYPALIVPYSAYLPAELIEKLTALSAQGAKIAFVGARPEGCTCGKVISLEEVPAFVRAAGGQGVSIAPAFPLLRVLHKKRGDADVFMLVNESMTEDFAGEVRLPVAGEGARLDLLLDRACRIWAEDGILPLKLGRGQSTLLVFGEELPEEIGPEAVYTAERPLQAQWTLSLRDAEGGDWGEKRPIDALYNITGPQGDMEFSGWMRYETEFEAEGAMALDLGFVGECAHVWLNGIDLGERIDAPYLFDISSAVRPGKNALVVEAANSLVYRHPDYFSHYMQIQPSGLLGPVRLLSK